MSRLTTILLCLGILIALAMAGAALVFGYTAMILIGVVAFVVLCAVSMFLTGVL